MSESADGVSGAGTVQEDGRLWVRASTVVGVVAAILTTLGIVVVHPHALPHFAYYAAFWVVIIAVVERESLPDFSLAFVVNAVFTAAFFLIQTRIYPESYGTTSPLGSWTDDSYFFALVADDIPALLEVRDNYFLYSHPFTDFIRLVTVFRIDHPMDVMFFQSGIAAALATFSKRFMWRMSENPQLAATVFLLTMICPFLMMNGGVILLRDTATAALFVFSLYSLESGRHLTAVGALAMLVAVRAGTALIFLPAYGIIYSAEIWEFLKKHAWWAVGVGATLVGLGIWAFLESEFLMEWAIYVMTGNAEGGGVGLLGREVYETILAYGTNEVLLRIQEQPFAIKLVLNGAYIFLYPFLSLKEAFGTPHFDLRSFTMTLVTPLYAFWLNAWFIAGAVTRVQVTRKQRRIVLAAVASFLMIGTYSLQTRHKTTLYPLYYFVTSVGLVAAGPVARRIGYVASALLVLLQVALMFR